MKAITSSCTLCGVYHDNIAKNYCPECETIRPELCRDEGLRSPLSVSDISALEHDCDASFLIELDESDMKLLY